jgi:hypothetical protein
MKAKELETKSAGYYAYAASRDASMKSFAASTFYTEAEKVTAERVKLGLEIVYSAKGVYLTYRKKFISIKLDGARVRDRVNLKFLEAEYETKGYIKKSTAQGIIYRIPKI